MGLGGFFGHAIQKFVIRRLFLLLFICLSEDTLFFVEILVQWFWVWIIAGSLGKDWHAQNGMEMGRDLLLLLRYFPFNDSIRFNLGWRSSDWNGWAGFGWLTHLLFSKDGPILIWRIRILLNLAIHMHGRWWVAWHWHLHGTGETLGSIQNRFTHNNALVSFANNEHWSGLAG